MIDFYKIGTNYYRADNNSKILNPTDLQTLARSGGKEIPAPVAKTGSVPIPNPVAIPSYDVTNRIGGTLYGTPKRSGADILVPTSQPEQTGLEGWKSGTNLVEAARSIIQMKQGYNKDIQTAKQVWGEKARDTSAWSGAQTIFSGMSPADQASIRAKQYATAEAHLQGLSDEEKYRAVRTEDTLKYISDIYKEKITELDNQKKDANDKEKIALDKRTLLMQEERNRILNAKDKIDMGIDLTAEDIYGTNVTSNFSRIGFKEGGTLSWRSNNPGNIKFGDFARKYGAIQGSKATDGGYFSIFPDEETGKQAMKDLLKAPSYQNLSIEDAMRRWSNKGYGAEIYKRGISMPMSKLNDQQLSELTDAMVKREGWKEGKTLKQKSTPPDLELTNAVKTGLMSEAGLTNADVKGYSADDWISLKNTIREATIEHATNILNVGDNKTPPMKKQITVRGQVIDNPSPDLVYSELQLKYPSLSTNELNAIMQQAGYILSIGILGSKWTAPTK